MGKGRKSKRSSKHERDAEEGDGGHSEGEKSEWSKKKSQLVLVSSGLQFVFGIVFIVVGSLNVEKCNIEPMIPVWLILMGILYLISGIHEIIQQFQVTRKKKSRHVVAKAISVLLFLPTVALIIAGNVWVYSAWGASPDYGHYWFSNGCDQGTYFLAFVGIIIIDVVFGFLILGVLSALACVMCLSMYNADEE